MFHGIQVHSVILHGLHLISLKSWFAYSLVRIKQNKPHSLTEICLFEAQNEKKEKRSKWEPWIIPPYHFIIVSVQCNSEIKAEFELEVRMFCCRMICICQLSLSSWLIWPGTNSHFEPTYWALLTASSVTCSHPLWDGAHFPIWAAAFYDRVTCIINSLRRRSLCF